MDVRDINKTKAWFEVFANQGAKPNSDDDLGLRRLDRG
jgi:hypothetical protein